MPEGGTKPEGAAGGRGPSALARMGDFELLAWLGRGTTGAVFKARHVPMLRIVALKVLAPRLAEEPAYVGRFLREGRAAAKLTHPNLVQGIDVGQAEGYYYFVMEFVDGGTVRDLIRQAGRLDETRALEIVADVARALEHAHPHGIVHRNIKPANIMLTREGGVKLADLGLARSVREVDAAAAGRAALSTSHYMAPEHARGEADIDTRADIYALGVTLYHMVTGELPFDGPTPADIMAKAVAEPFPSPRDRNPQLSRAVCGLIERMTAKDPADRPQDPTELLREVHGTLGGKAALRPSSWAKAKARRPASRTAARRPRRTRSRALWIAAGACLIALVVAIAALSRRGGTPPGPPGGRLAKAPRRAVPREPPRAAPQSSRHPPRVTGSKARGHEVAAERAKARLAELLLNRDFKGGAALLAELTSRRTIPAAALDELRTALLDAATEAVAQLDERAEPLREQGKFDEATALYQQALGWRLEPLRPTLDRRLANIQQEKAAAAQAATEAAAERFEAVFKKDVAPLLAKRRYAEAGAALEKLAARDDLKAAAEAIDRARKDVGRLLAFWGQVDRRAAALKPGQRILIQGRLVPVRSYGDGVLRYALGPAEAGIALARMDATDIVGLLGPGCFRDEPTCLQGVAFALFDAPPDLELAEALLRKLPRSEDTDRYRSILADHKKREQARAAAADSERPARAWVELFDGKSLRGWEVAEEGHFAHGGRVHVDDGRIVMERGHFYTGIAWRGRCPRVDYEVLVEAMAVDGMKEFCDVNFPFGTSACTLAVGFRGGRIAGLHLLDGQWCDRNPSTARIDIQYGRWYRIRLRVGRDRIQAWLGDRKLIDLPTGGHTLSLDPVHRYGRPLVVHAHRATAAVRTIALRRLEPRE